MKEKIINILYSIIILTFTFFIFYFSINTKDSFLQTLMFLFQIIIPSLFPFMIFINFILLSNCIDYLSLFLAPIGKLFKISGYGMTCVVASLLGGYPYSAIIVSSFLKDNKITKNEATRLLMSMFFPSISFLFVTLYNIDNFFIFQILSLYISSFLLLFITSFIYKEKIIKEKNTIKINNNFSLTYYNVMKSCMNSLFSISFSIIFFSLIAQLFNKVVDNNYLLYLIKGVLEFSSTSIELLLIKNKSFLDYLLIMNIISFSSFSIIFQSYFYLLDSEISIKKLLLSRVTICIISSIIFTIFYLLFK